MNDADFTVKRHVDFAHDDGQSRNFDEACHQVGYLRVFEDREEVCRDIGDFAVDRLMWRV